MTTNKRVSVTEIDTYNKCPRLWRYKFKDGLRTKELNQAMVSGTAIHAGVEALSLGRDGVTAALDTLAELAGERGERFKRGVLTALDGLPDWVAKVKSPVTEDKLEVVYGSITVVGRPDIWFQEGDTIEIWDYKSTSKDEDRRLSQYDQWNDQPRFYGVLLHDHLISQGINPPPIIYTGHIILSTRGKHAVGTPTILAGKLLDDTRERMLDLAAAVGEHETMHMSAFNCGMCDFSKLCEGALTGYPLGDIVEQEYTRDERRTHPIT